MPKAVDTHTPPPPPLTSGKTALARLEITHQLAAFARLMPDHPDAALISSCMAHPRHIDAVEGSDFDGEDADDPAWQAYERTRAVISRAEPRTIEGILAKAWAAKAEALQSDGTEDRDYPAGDWVWQLVDDLIRLNAAPSPDAELIALCEQYVAAEKQILALYDGPNELDEDQASQGLSAIGEQMHPMLDRMEQLRAQTTAGIHARARAMTSSNPEFAHSFEAEGTFPYRLLAVLMRDAMALGEARQ